MRRLLLEGDWRVNPFLPIAVVALFFSFTGTALFVVGECTKGLSQKYANFEDAAAVCLGSAYDERGDYDIDPQDARLVLKWRREFDALLEGRKP